jgi:predicted dehydrogenase
VGKHWRSAVIGTNVVGVTHLRAISTTPMCSLAAVCDLVPARAQTALAKLGLNDVPVYESLPEMLRKEKPDVVHICTPSGAHLDCALESIKAGVNVICEKPLEVTLARCDQMLEAADKANVRVGGIFQYRWNEANAAIRGAVEQGRFGRVAWAGSFTPWWRPDEYFETGGWRGTWKMDGGGAIMNQSIHAIDLIHWFAGPIKTVCAFFGRRAHDKIEVEDTLSATLQFASGAFGTILGTTAMYPGAPVRVEIGGENGTAVSEDGLKVFKFREPRPEDADLTAKYGQLVSVTREALSNKDAIDRAAEAKTKLHRQNIESILGAWQENRDADTSGKEARKAVAITTALYESARKNGAPVDVR